MSDIILKLVDDVLAEIPVDGSFEFAPCLLVGLCERSFRNEALDIIELPRERLHDDFLVFLLEIFLLSHHYILR